MKALLLLVLSIFLFGAPARAQITASSWDPYDFEFELPEGWVAQSSRQQLLLAEPADIDRIQSAQSPLGLVLTVRVIEPLLRPLSTSGLSNYGLTDADPEMRTFGSDVWPSIDLRSVESQRGIMILVADTFLVTASAPADTWDDTLPMLEDIIASIEAAPANLFLEERLIQPIAWRGIHLFTPENWVMAPSVHPPNNFTLSPVTARLDMMSAFRPISLVIEVRDLSQMRQMLTPDSLSFLESGFFSGGDAVREPVERVEISGFTASAQEFEAFNGLGAGKSFLLLTNETAYLIVGVADKERWNETEAALFAAIMATLEVNAAE